VTTCARSASAALRVCTIGYFQPDKGQFGCVSCDILLGGFYQELSAQSSCVACAPNTQRFVGVLTAANRSSCQCKEGFYTEAGRPGEECKACPRGSVCLGRLDPPVRNDNVRLAVLVPTATSWPEGRASIGAIALAIDDVNSRAAVIGGPKISYAWREVDCDRAKALAALSLMLEEGPVDAVIGPDCSTACESTAILTAAREMPQISYSCSSTILSDKHLYPTVRRTHVLHPSPVFARFWLRKLWLAVRAHNVELLQLDASSSPFRTMGEMETLRHLVGRHGQ